MVYINDHFKFIFIENPKSGSTAIIKALEKVLRVKINRRNPEQAHLTCDQIKGVYPEKWENYIKVTTYRDPFKRFCSSVEFILHQKQGQFINFIEFQNHRLNGNCVYCLP